MLKELSEDLNSIKKIQAETKDILIEIKNNLQGNNSRVDEAENQINDLAHKKAKKKQSEQEEKRIQKNENSVRSLWEKFKRSNICIIGCQQEKRKIKTLEIYLKKIMKEKFPNMVKEIDMQVQEAQSPKQEGYKMAHFKTHHN